MNFKIKLLSLLTISVFFSCGTLGGIGPTFYFPTSKSKLEKLFSKMYEENSEYNIPDSLKKYDTWSKRGYGFLEGRIFFFKRPPEELYYVTFVGDSSTFADTTKIGIAIRAVYQPEKSNKWLAGTELTNEEKDRIIRRFNLEIISKLEMHTKTKATKEE
jgi:hypothetical protein